MSASSHPNPSPHSFSQRSPSHRSSSQPGARLVLVLAATVLLADPMAAQTTAPDPAEGSAPFSQRAEVDAVFAAYDRTDSPGCALGVMRAGDLIYARGYGMANLELREAIGPASVFRIGSVSKQFTAATVVRAAQAGFLSLDDDIRKHLPEMPIYQRPVTVRMLLHHTSGIRDYLALMSLAGLRDTDWYSIDEAFEIIARQQETNFPPGDENLYSNAGYFLLSQIVERATGSSLREFAQAHLFGPLGMHHTHFHDDHTHVVPERASGYAPRREQDGFRISMTTLDMVGDGGVYTTIEDLTRWDANFYQPTVGGQAFLDEMLARGVLTNGEQIDYALGLIHGTYRGVPRVSHGGAFVGFRAQMMRFPEQRTSIAVLCNLATTNPTALAEQVADVVLVDALEPAATPPSESPNPSADSTPVELTSAQLARWAGLYRGDDDFSMRFEMNAGRLVVAVGPGYPLLPRAEDRFDVDGAPVSFSFREVDGTRKVTMHQGDSTREGAAVELVQLTGASAAGYAGRYHATELGVDYLITSNGPTLLLERGRQEPRELVPTVRDEFELGGATLRFERVDGQPSAFSIDAGRVRGIRFERVGTSAQP